MIDRAKFTLGRAWEMRETGQMESNQGDIVIFYAGESVGRNIMAVGVPTKLGTEWGQEHSPAASFGNVNCKK